MYGKRAKPIPPEAGDVFEVPYPFVRDEYTQAEYDPDGAHLAKPSPTWKPGIRHELRGYEGGYDIALADGQGAQLLTVVSRHKPGKYPERVFYTRKWRDPDGKEFGKPELRITSMVAWRAKISGYRHPYELSGGNRRPADLIAGPTQGVPEERG